VSFGATAPSGPVRTRLGFGSIVWALIPLLSLGLLAPVPFAVAAVRLRQRRLWVATAVYALGSALLILGAFGPQGGWGDTLAGTVILLLMVAGTAHAFLLRGRVFAPSPTEPRRSHGGCCWFSRSGCCCWALGSWLLPCTTWWTTCVLPRRPAGVPRGW
jgi:hypothetical protein